MLFIVQSQSLLFTSALGGRVSSISITNCILFPDDIGIILRQDKNEYFVFIHKKFGYVSKHHIKLL